MDKTTYALLLEVCKEKGVDLNASLKNDVDTVLKIMSEDVILSGIKRKVDDYESRVAWIQNANFSIDVLETNMHGAQEKINRMKADLSSISRLATEMEEKRRAGYLLTDTKLNEARMLAAGMLHDAIEMLGKDLPAEVICSIYEMASYTVWGQREEVTQPSSRRKPI